jgi:hypothetical protein
MSYLEALKLFQTACTKTSHCLLFIHNWSRHSELPFCSNVTRPILLKAMYKNFVFTTKNNLNSSIKSEYLVRTFTRNIPVEWREPHYSLAREKKMHSSPQPQCPYWFCGAVSCWEAGVVEVFFRRSNSVALSQFHCSLLWNRSDTLDVHNLSQKTGVRRPISRPRRLTTDSLQTCSFKNKCCCYRRIFNYLGY